MPPPPCRHLFVYGTLMSTAAGLLGHDMRMRLKHDSRVVGAATLPGRLYDLGDYPAMVRSHETGDVVHGELLELAAPAAALIYLDAYEGIGRGAQAVGEYVREVVPATLEGSGDVVDAWVYRYDRPSRSLHRIAGGRWTGPQ